MTVKTSKTKMEEDSNSEENNINVELIKAVK